MTRILLFYFLFVANISLGQIVKMTHFDNKNFPEVSLFLYSRNPNELNKEDISISENGNNINDFQWIKRDIKSHSKQIVFILFQNSFWPSYTTQRGYFKKLLESTLSPSFGKDDILYFVEFDWTDKNGQVISDDRIFKGSVTDLKSTIAKISPPTKESRLHEYSEVNTALFQALGFLHKINADSGCAKSIIILSDELSNIYNSQYTQADIKIASLQKNIPIYAIRYPRMADKYNLRQVAEETYGLHLNADPENFQKTEQAFSEMLKAMPLRSGGSSYVLNFESKTAIGNKQIKVDLLHQKNKQVDTFILDTPSWGEWILAAPLRIVLLLTLIFSALGLILFFVLRARKKAKQEKALQDEKIKQAVNENDKKLQEQEEKFLKQQYEKEEEAKEQQFLKEKSAFEQASYERFKSRTRQASLVDNNGQVHHLQHLVTTIGRANDCQIILNNSMVSKKHTLILFEKQSEHDIPTLSHIFYILDLESTNGVFVNGQRIKKATPLKDGDMLTIGNIGFSFRC